MFAREWRARCPLQNTEGFLKYLYQTGIKDTSTTSGFRGAQILIREFNGGNEIILISHWNSLDSIKAFAGDDIALARLYPEDYQYELEPDNFVTHYEVLENIWLDAEVGT